MCAHLLVRERFRSALLITLMAVSAAGTNLPAVETVTRIADIRRLPLHTAAPPPTVRLRGVVTSMSGWKNSFFLQDGTGGISVDRKEDTPVRAGNEVEVLGTIEPGLFAPVVIAVRIEVLGDGPLPAARKATYADIARGQLDSQWIELDGVVHSARVSEIWGRRVLFIELHTLGGTVTVHVLDFPKQSFDYLVDSGVRVRGVCGTVFNDRKQLIGLRLFAPGMDQIQIGTPAIDPWHIPLTSFEDLLVFNPDRTFEHRVRVSGIVTYQAGPRIYLEESKIGLRVESDQQVVFAPGTRLEASGFVSPGEYSPTLRNAVLRPTGSVIAPPPVRVSAGTIITRKDGFTIAPYDGRLVQLEGDLLELLPQGGDQIWVLRDRNVLFRADLNAAARTVIPGVEPGSRVTVTGICVADLDENQNAKSFHLLLRTPRDFAVLHTPYSTFSKSIFLTIFLLLLTASGAIWLLGERRSQHLLPADDVIPSPWAPTFERISKTLTAVVGSGGALALIGWRFDIGVLKSVRPEYVATKPNAALAFLAAAGALWMMKSRAKSARGTLALICTAIVIGTAFLTLVEFGTGWNLHVDQLLFPEQGPLIATVSPGRMALVSAFGFLLIGCALFLVRSRRLVVLAQSLALLTGVLALLTLMGYLYGIKNFYGIEVYTAMALPTAILLLLLSAAVLFCYADRGLMKDISSSAPGGVMARRLLPAALLVTAILGWFRWKGQLHGYYETAFGLALFTSANIVSFVFLLWNSAAFLNRLDLARSRAERELGHRERQLGESEERYRTVVESLPQMVWTCGPDGGVDYVSRQWVEYTGVPEKQQLGEGWDRCLHLEDRDQIVTSWRAAVDSGATFDAEYRLRNAAGDYRWFRALAVPMRDSNRVVTRWFGSSTDIQQMKIAESQIRSFNKTLGKRVKERTAELVHVNEDLSSTRARLQSVLDSAAQVAVVALDLEGVIQLFSKGAELLLGYSAAEVVGQHTPRLFLRPEDCQLRAAELSERLGRPVAPSEIFTAQGLPAEPYTREAVYVRRDGTPLNVNLAVAPMLDGAGQRTGTLGVASDVTVRRMLEIQLTAMNAELREQKHAAEAANLAKSDFLAAMSHEIRTPMNSIIGTSDLLLDTELNPGQHRLVSICRRNSNLLLRLINDLLDLSKIEADAVELENVPFSILELAEDIEQIFFANAKEKGIDLQTMVDPHVPAIVVGDPNRLKQVIINLFSNSLKFTAKGRVSLSFGIAESSNQAGGCTLRFAVSDSGIGIAPEHLGSIFGAFQQADSSVTRRFGGTGLGLAISKRLVELMGGTISAESTLGMGSTFLGTVQLGVSESAAEIVRLGNTREIRPKTAPINGPIVLATTLGAAVGLPVRVRSNAAGVILIVEDHEDNSFLINSFLATEGYELDGARNGQEAVEKVKANQYALILMDIQMPVMDGYTATREIRAWEKARDAGPVPIIALTAHALRGEEEKSFQAGCSGHLSKPLVRRTLIQEVGKWVRTGAPASEAQVVASAEKIRLRAPAYLARRNADIERMRASLRDGVFESIRVLGHQLNGSATGHGFPGFSRLGAEIEKAAKAEDAIAVEEHLRSLEALVRELQAKQIGSETGGGVLIPS